MVKIDLETGKPIETIKFEIGNVCMISRGRNAGRVGVMQHIERHPGSFDIVSVKDGAGHVFATRLQNIFTMGHGTRTMVRSYVPNSFFVHCLVNKFGEWRLCTSPERECW